MNEGVGPVLQTGALADAVIAAIEELNEEVIVLERGAYSRITVAGKCVLTREAVERHLGRPMRFPAELESIMPSFHGHLKISEQQAAWESQQ